jgi:hypothetical protein
VKVNWTKLKTSTISLLALVASGTLSVQVEWIKNHIIPLLANHPHLSTLGGGLIMIVTILHEPQALSIIEKFTTQETTQTESGEVQKTTITEVAATPPVSK